MPEAVTSIDYLRFRSHHQPRAICAAMAHLFYSAPLRDGEAEKVLTLKPLQRGLRGFQQGAEVMLFGEVKIGRMDYGGDSQRGWVRVDMGGEGCGWVADWPGFEGVLAGLDAEIRRLDIALTTYAGEVNHAMVVAAHGAGQFRGKMGPPRHLEQITSSNQDAGKTCNIGSRESDVFFRCYEKGRELASKRSGLTTHIDGVPVDDIYRVEVEFKAVNRPIGLDTIRLRDEYFAAASPFCRSLLPMVAEVSLPDRRARHAVDELEVQLSHCRHQYGRTLATALKAFGGDPAALLAKILSDSDNPRLVERGVHLVPHALVRQLVGA